MNKVIMFVLPLILFSYGMTQPTFSSTLSDYHHARQSIIDAPQHLENYRQLKKAYLTLFPVAVPQFKHLFRKVKQTITKMDWHHCLHSSQALLAHNYSHLGGHYAAMICHYESHNKVKAQYHETLLNQWLSLIWTTGNGEREITAFHVSDIDERDTFIELHGLILASKPTLHKPNLIHALSLIDAQNNAITWYFKLLQREH